MTDLAKMAYLVGQITGHWKKFKETHDVTSEQFQCCEVTAEFFKALDNLELMDVSNHEKKAAAGQCSSF